ncbi:MULTISPECIES: hypothetical protein [Clostridium]|uniref:hypothetical protein n=1 Tax=Clostridium TaxID=1485 RepID=UPI0032EE72AC
MNYKKMKNIVDGIVENEFIHIPNIEETYFENENFKYKQKQLATKSIKEVLKLDTTEEQQRLIRELEDSISDEWLELCRFYFREGVRAGLGSLKFLNEIDDVGTIL